MDASPPAMEVFYYSPSETLRFRTSLVSRCHSFASHLSQSSQSTLAYEGPRKMKSEKTTRATTLPPYLTSEAQQLLSTMVLCQCSNAS